MTIVATCGHEVSAKWLANRRSRLIEKSHTREGDRALSYTVRCPKCRRWFERAGELFKNESSGLRWMRRAVRP